jgi:hypothetical protein
MPPVQSFRAQNAIRIRILNYGACMERVRAWHFAHSKWACFYAQNSSWAGLGNFGPPFGAANWSVWTANWRVSPGDGPLVMGPPRLCPASLLFNVHDIYLLPRALFCQLLLRSGDLSAPLPCQSRQLSQILHGENHA